ncbi:hypothetical protein [Rhodopirellula halodulae]|uniref:hypothetical protein n=1 Tax=Rhodopirellula halodulae TaxID=2894198 RepID=UPI001E568E21|nr:hypothetical protein [Rhodopirellula sp. JC737]MCC9658803.1 hypothetical protein [Rhodopirellula sp. JC737]
MRISISTAARNRAFSRACRRVRNDVQATLDRIAATELRDPTWETVLLIIADELDAQAISEIPNNDDLLQLQTGFPSFDDYTPANDSAIFRAFLTQIGLAVDQCGLTPSDRERIFAILETTSD